MKLAGALEIKAPANFMINAFWAGGVMVADGVGWGWFGLPGEGSQFSGTMPFPIGVSAHQ